MYISIFGHPKIKLRSVILCYISLDQSLHDHANISFAFGMNSASDDCHFKCQSFRYSNPLWFSTLANWQSGRSPYAAERYQLRRCDGVGFSHATQSTAPCPQL